eukprot:161656-Chlamydomonas_euryale.AAC.7
MSPTTVCRSGAVGQLRSRECLPAKGEKAERGEGGMGESGGRAVMQFSPPPLPRSTRRVGALPLPQLPFHAFRRGICGRRAFACAHVFAAPARWRGGAEVASCRHEAVAAGSSQLLCRGNRG